MREKNLGNAERVCPRRVYIDLIGDFGEVLQKCQVRNTRNLCVISDQMYECGSGEKSM